MAGRRFAHHPAARKPKSNSAEFPKGCPHGLGRANQPWPSAIALGARPSAHPARWGAPSCARCGGVRSSGPLARPAGTWFTEGTIPRASPLATSVRPCGTGTAQKTGTPMAGRIPSPPTAADHKPMRTARPRAARRHEGTGCHPRFFLSTVRQMGHFSPASKRSGKIQEPKMARSTSSGTSAGAETGAENGSRGKVVCPVPRMGSLPGWFDAAVRAGAVRCLP